jgi:hypothetical protein
MGCFCGAFSPAKATKPIESPIQVRKSCGHRQEFRLGKACKFQLGKSNERGLYQIWLITINTKK